ncbi:MULTISPECIES: pyridoxal 5'-phosphate synthase glutaminase subunit PdxT [Virgibacillus]|uniref:Pyridoxal 5'-phosphate synthase subunit PdxT n=1 Tax=Virgibacillus pantothenticus TaxID=1473 RepID=A0A0L0QRD6_VIRPA|nr:MULTISPECIES: pyridoxal 5'-phosphate synthase glutaminase subunit PdxT [Virgibacillus]API92233.1 glutamine amidotransferase subunit PdxT [Virgibacillus sp. 6R]KNE21159.1 glutamine amidotransferase [Virgibacillus pantothenticus]MBS7427169.1 pyridoxal 5'-phosphate synthase glutaminase subunit PdxT [Virgibacillus sp. 19R1-5]MBU8567473.1 pyridoxal 5'-phosphate synthase glutaminase subunit PdxT [Virgibacillus pantothenticus]MBU8601165.1 pyridoxal 5'-phosphate synthase glutaminase subunit PdxT [V
MTTIGVLALQGAVREHIRSIRACDAQAIEIKRKEQLAEIDGLILPGGESTTIRRLMDSYGFFTAIQDFARQGKPIFGTCAGMIIMAKLIQGQAKAHLGLIDMTVARNAFGRQVASFEAEINVAGIADDFRAVFIRAPYVVEVGDDVEILAAYKEHIVAVRQGPFIATAFHPELTDDHRLISYFMDMVAQAK